MKQSHSVDVEGWVKLAFMHEGVTLLDIWQLVKEIG